MPDLREIDRRSGAAYERRAVVDIGSNSVRLVIYDGPRRAPFAICNEKALCGLGRDMSPEGDLNPAAVDYAMETLARFRRLLSDHDNPPVHAIATAAVREARNREDFVARAAALGFDIEVIDGEREAALAALGVVSYEPGATGIVGDMGGGSLELIGVDGANISEKTSLSIGPLRLMQVSGGDLKAVAKHVDATLKEVKWVKAEKFQTLYMVGGAWRAVARIHMRLKNHPLTVLHHYKMTPADVIEVCDLIARQSRQSLEEIDGLPKRRIDTMPYASLVLKAVVKQAGVKRILVSAGGVREGVLFDQLSGSEKCEEPLLAGARFVSERLAPSVEIGAAAARVISPLFPEETLDQKRIRVATAELIDIGAYFHPDLRGMHAFDTALRSPFYGLSHADRVSIAYALFVRHNGRTASPPDPQIVALLSEEGLKRSVQVGLALRFLASFAPKSPASLADCELRLEKDAVVFCHPKDAVALMRESQLRRLEAVAAEFGVPARVEAV